MVFSSLPYVFFLLITVGLYWTMPVRFRVPLLLLASYIFYMSWKPPQSIFYGILIFLDSLYFYGLSVAMVRWPQHKKKLLIFGVVSELCLLGYFKYTNFLLGTTETLLQWLHLPSFHLQLDIFLPLAISFTNFILISYLVDVYRGRETPDPSFTRFATYVAFFPHLIAGPIVRASELLHQFDTNPAFDWSRMVQGIHKFCMGLFIKLFVADLVAGYVNQIYGDPSLQGFNTSWAATYAFALQIFCDFSGYTLMAQGSALMMGYTLPENFNAPYFAQNISDFWRRWHMSLSRWLKDYLYIPLGGSRGTQFQTTRNLFITMALGGLWHGASWNFVIWGIYQGLLLSLHKLAQFLKLTRFIPKPVALLLTFHLVCVGWVFFRAQTLPAALHLLATMVNPTHWVNTLSHVTDVIETHSYAIETSTIFAIVVLFFSAHALIRYFRPRLTSPMVREWAVAVAYCVLLFFGLTIGGAKTQEFIYFQF